MKTIKVLFISDSMEIGGVGKGILNFAKIIPKEDVEFSLIVLNKNIGSYEQEYKNYGNIYHFPLLHSSNPFLCGISIILNNILFRIKLINLFKKNKFDVVHCKSIRYSASAVKIAKKINVPIRITQSHVDKPVKQHKFFELYYNWCAKIIEKNATHKLAVSPKAIDYLYGKYGGRVIQNPTISLEKLDPNKFEVKSHEEINLIQIGTFSRRKNQCFSINILKELLNIGINAKLTIVGFSLDEPDYINQINALINKLNLKKHIEFLPKDSDIPKLLSESDYMLLPSISEGLPNVVLESQAMGVPCFLSDTVNPDTDCGLCVFLSLDKGTKYWAEKILEYRKENGTEKRYVDMSKWDNKEVVKEYLKIWGYYEFD